MAPSHSKYTLPFFGIATEPPPSTLSSQPSTLNSYLYQPTPVTSRYASPYGNDSSNPFSTPQSCGTRTLFHPESSKSHAAHPNFGRFHWQKPVRMTASSMRLISPCVRLSGADGSSPLANRHPSASGTFTVDATSDSADVAYATATVADKTAMCSFFMASISGLGCFRLLRQLSLHQTRSMRLGLMKA